MRPSRRDRDTEKGCSVFRNTIDPARFERSVDPRAQMLRALNAEASKFPSLHRRYFDEVVAPRRAVLLGLLARGVERGEIDADVDLDLAASVLVAPIPVSYT